MTQNNNEIINAVHKYCSNYNCTDEDTVTKLTYLFTSVGSAPTPAQAKIILGDMDILHMVIQLTVQSIDIYHECHEIGAALVEVLKLKEPCFLNTFLAAQTDKLVRIIPVSRYLLVCTEEAARNVLKNFDAYTTRANQLEKAYFKRTNEVYEYAMHTIMQAEQFDIRNAYMAAWYILTDCKPFIQLVNGKYSTKQLKDAISNVQAIDRYAMIQPRDYSDIITQQSEILHTIKTALFKANACMHVFKQADELAEEGIRMGNCIATYWSHDATSCLFSVDYKGQHMDVELIKDWQAEYDKWLPSQVFIANNEVNDITGEVEKILDEVCMKYNTAAKAEWIATFKPNKTICSQANGCEDCISRYCCPASPDYVEEDSEPIEGTFLDDLDLDLAF